MDKAERIAEILNGMDDSDLVAIYNEVVGGDDYVYEMYEFYDEAENIDIDALLEIGAAGFDTSAGYYKHTIYGYESGEAWDFIDCDELAEYVVMDNKDFGFDEIREILDSDEMEDEVEEDDE